MVADFLCVTFDVRRPKRLGMEEDVDAGAVVVVGVDFTGDIDLEDSLDSRGVRADLVDRGKEYEGRVVFVVRLVDG